MESLFANQVFDFHDYVDNLHEQADRFNGIYYQLKQEQEDLWDWMRANEYLESENGSWLIDVRVGDISPAYDYALNQYYVKEEQMQVAQTIYREMMMVVEMWSAAPAA